MAIRVWIWTVLVLLLAAAILLMPSQRIYAHLRDSHSHPASIILRQQVIVSDEGNVFHAPWCKYIQGKHPHPVDGREAVAKGYAPCVRCMGWTIAK